MSGKPGLAGRLREWMRARRMPFTPADAAGGIGIPPGPERDAVRSAVTDFLARGEVVRAAGGGYLYNHAYRKPGRGALRPKILKAMHVCPTWTCSDLMRLAGAEERSYINRLVKRLAVAGLVRRVGRRRASETGIEAVYQVADRSRFRTEVLG